jgi:hypothetical protein
MYANSGVERAPAGLNADLENVHKPDAKSLTTIITSEID